MQMMAKIIGVTHIFIYQVPKFKYFSTLQKGKGVDSHITPKKISYGSTRIIGMSNFTKRHLTHEIFRILPVFSQFL